MSIDPMWRAAAGVLALVAGTAGTAGRLPAMQHPADPPPDTLEPRTGCLRGAPLPDCASFWIVEVQRSTALLRPSWTRSGYSGGSIEGQAGPTQFEWTLGYMSNRSAHWALGGTVSLGPTVEGGVTGVRLRARRWLNPSLSLSIETGLARSTAQRGVFGTGAGPSAGLRIDADDNVAVFVRYDRVAAIPLGTPGTLDSAREHEYLRVGAGVGSKAALIGSGVALVAMVIVGAIFFNGAT